MEPMPAMDAGTTAPRGRPNRPQRPGRMDFRPVFGFGPSS
jgi:hypothetical protein